MAGLSYRLRADLRSQMRSYASVALLVGLLGGMVMAAVAGARRTANVLDRFTREYGQPDVVVPNVPDPTGRSAQFSPTQVSSLGPVASLKATYPVPLVVHGQSAFGVAPEDPMLNTAGPGYRLKVVAGRLPDERRPDEAVIAYQSARLRGVRVGDRIPFTLPPPLAAAMTEAGARLPETLHVVGVYLVPSEFPPTTIQTDFHLSNALYRALPPNPTPSMVIRLRHGASDIPILRSELTQMAAGKQVVLVDFAAATAESRRSIQVQTAAFWVLAAVAGFTAVIILAQLIARHLALRAADYPALHEIGMSHRQLWGLGILRASVVALLGTPLAIAIAYLLSPLTPIGTARLAEPFPGLAFDVVPLIVGAAVLVALTMVIAAVPAHRTARAATTTSAKELKSFGRASSITWLPYAVLLGIRFAFQRGRGRRAVPVASTVGTLGVAAMVLTVALVFGSSLTHLLGTPRLYGRGWSLSLVSEGPDLRAKSAVFTTDPAVDGLAFGVSGVSLEVDGHAVDVAAFDPPVEGAVAPPIVTGRPPSRPDEIALGSRTMSALGVHLGDRLAVRFADGPVSKLLLVGQAVIPPPSVNAAQGLHSSTALGFGSGGLITYSGLANLSPVAAPPPSAFLLLAPGENPSMVSARLVGALGPGVSADFFASPEDLFNFGRIRNMPLVLAGAVSVLAAATLVHMLVSSVRRRRRDIGVLKSLGLDRRQVSEIVCWQASALALVALVVGIPLGLLAGRGGWTYLAGRQGVLTEARYPLVQLGEAAVVVVVLANAIALFPGRRAARLTVTTALRVE